MTELSSCQSKKARQRRNLLLFWCRSSRSEDISIICSSVLAANYFCSLLVIRDLLDFPPVRSAFVVIQMPRRSTVMTFLLSSVVATIILAADPVCKVCLLAYRPHPRMRSLRASPRRSACFTSTGRVRPHRMLPAAARPKRWLPSRKVQEFLRELGKSIAGYRQEQDEEAKRREEPPKGGTQARIAGRHEGDAASLARRHSLVRRSVNWECPGRNREIQHSDPRLTVTGSRSCSLTPRRFFSRTSGPAPQTSERRPTTSSRSRLPMLRQPRRRKGMPPKTWRSEAGMVVSLGPDADRLQAKFIEYLEQARKAGAAAGFGANQDRG